MTTGTNFRLWHYPAGVANRLARQLLGYFCRDGGQPGLCWVGFPAHAKNTLASERQLSGIPASRNPP